MSRKASFTPIADRRTRILVLGSLPGEESLNARQYYANPTNQFWRLIGHVIDQDIVHLPYEKRLERLVESGVGLWDVISDAERMGSLDADIRNHRENPFVELAKTLPNIRALGFNGGKPAKIGLRQLQGQSQLTPITLPSSSAAYCSISLADKMKSWARLRDFL